MSQTPLVEAVGVSRRFGGIQALTDVSVAFYPGEVHALVGANGAGKSTLKNVISGAILPDNGEVRVDGHSVALGLPRDARDLGIYAVHQEVGLIPWMSVEDNMFLARYPTHLPGAINRRVLRRQTEEALAGFGLHLSTKAKIGTLSVAQQQLVEISRAVYAKPRCLLLDEPSAVLVGPELERVLSTVERLRSEGVAIVYVSHRLEEVFRLADRVTVMRNGEVVVTAETKSFTHDSLISAMTGKPVDHSVASMRSTQPAPVRLDVERLSAGGGRLRDLSLQVHARGDSRNRGPHGKRTFAPGEVPVRH